jgi:hypothetical protein
VNDMTALIARTRKGYSWTPAPKPAARTQEAPAQPAQKPPPAGELCGCCPDDLACTQAPVYVLPRHEYEGPRWPVALPSARRPVSAV